MAGANSHLQLIGTDFNEIKRNLVTFFRSQDILKDADYTGSVLSVLMDLLAYNTHFNSFYLNMVGNEMFLDTAIKRSSVISHAKLLNYHPSSVTCATAYVNIDILGLETKTFWMPKYTKFASGKVNNENYTFCTIREYFEQVDANNNIHLTDVVLKQGEPVSYSFIYDTVNNPKGIFTLPDSNIDLDTIEVIVQNSPTDYYTTVFNKFEDPLTLDNNSEVYFIQESFNGQYEIYFGNGILGRNLVDGNIVTVNYLSTDGGNANKAKTFMLLDELASYRTFRVTTVTPAFLGNIKESMESIKYLAPRMYSSQGRAVTPNDYVTLLKKNNNKFPIDAVNVWDGEENVPPIYGKVFVAVKPVGTYTITENQKKLIVENILKPIGLVGVSAEVVDVDYTYLKVNVDLVINKTKTVLTNSEIRSKVIQAIQSYADEKLNTFSSRLIIPDLITYINEVDPSIITNDQQIYLQKRIFPVLGVKNQYIADFGFPIQKGVFGESVSISPTIQYKSATGKILPEVYLEEFSTAETRIDSISIINKGYNYTSIPNVIIEGDGTGALAHAVLYNGRIASIIVDNPGQNYTQAVVRISGGGGQLGSAKAVLAGQYSLLRLYYYNNGVKTILNSSIGTVDYINGIVILTDFSPENINNLTGTLSINVIPDKNIVYSIREKLLTYDIDDPEAITINILPN